MHRHIFDSKIHLFRQRQHNRYLLQYSQFPPKRSICTRGNGLGHSRMAQGRLSMFHPASEKDLTGQVQSCNQHHLFGSCRSTGALRTVVTESAILFSVRLTFFPSHLLRQKTTRRSPDQHPQLGCGPSPALTILSGPGNVLLAVLGTMGDSWGRVNVGQLDASDDLQRSGFLPLDQVPR